MPPFRSHLSYPVANPLPLFPETPAPSHADVELCLGQLQRAIHAHQQTVGACCAWILANDDNHTDLIPLLSRLAELNQLNSNTLQTLSNAQSERSAEEHN